MGLRTPLYETHLSLGAKIVDFGGWDMPLTYGSQLEEHHAVRRDAGMFDVSHMGIVDVTGSGARDFLRHLLANDVARLAVPGHALYSCMLRPDGGILDDLLAYFLRTGRYRLVVNAGTRREDVAWIAARGRPFDVTVSDRQDLAIIAVQGPNARAKAAAALPEELRAAAMHLAPFSAACAHDWCVARTGYTGEDGFELMLPQQAAVGTWEALRSLGVAPAGLAARDTLRLEAGMNLYGNDMDESRNPLESRLAWTVAFDPAGRDFIGRAALEPLRGRPGPRLVGLLLEERGVLRSHQRVFRHPQPALADGATAAAADGAAAIGEITSGRFSPPLHRSIAFARLHGPAYATVYVDIRGRLHAARVVEPPFVRHGRPLIALQKNSGGGS